MTAPFLRHRKARCVHPVILLPLPLRLPHRVLEDFLEELSTSEGTGQGQVPNGGPVHVVNELVCAEPT